MPHKNQIITITITDMTHEGSGVGHWEGMAIFVPESAVGDQLMVRIVKVQKSHCFGKIEEILVPSPHRIASDCPVSRRCGGCVFRHVTYEAELAYKQAFVQSNLQRIGKQTLTVEPIEPSPHQEGYRNKAQYPIQMQNGSIVAGFFAPRSHEVIDCHNCKLQPQLFSTLLEIVLAFATEYQISIYDETSGKGLLRHLYLRQGEQSGEVMVCLVVNGNHLPLSDILIQQLCTVCPEIVSVMLNENTRNTNVILGNTNHILYGKNGIRDRLCGVWFDLSPLAFYQVNALAAQKLYGIAAEYAGLSGNEVVLDLYCGAGTIGLSLAEQCKQVIGVEIIPQAVENAKANAKTNGIDNARFLCADAAQAAAQLAQEQIHPDVVILDPPRKGCELSVLQSVASMAPSRIVMISCNSATMARDCALLAPLGYQVTRCKPVDLFPRTQHVETCVLLSHKNS